MFHNRQVDRTAAVPRKEPSAGRSRQVAYLVQNTIAPDLSRAPQLVSGRQDRCWQDNMVPALPARLEPVAAETASVAVHTVADTQAVDKPVVAKNQAAETAAVEMPAAADTQAVDKTKATVARRSRRLPTGLLESDKLSLEEMFRFQFQASATAGLSCWC